MFFPAPAPPDRDVAVLHALRRSLNNPVVAIEVLPAGPAAAAIALHGAPGEPPRVTIALRSMRSGQVAFFAADEERASFGSPGVALDAALSFAESMGFLFDDDEVEAAGDTGTEHAAQLWRAFVSTDPPGAAAQISPVAPPTEPPTELLLEEIDVVEPEPEPEPEPEIVAVPEPESPEEAELEHSGVEIEARTADLSDTAPNDVPPVGEAGQEASEAEAYREAVDQTADPEAPQVDPILLLTKFRRAAVGSGSPESPDGQPDAHLRLMSRF